MLGITTFITLEAAKRMAAAGEAEAQEWLECGNRDRGCQRRIDPVSKAR